MSENLRASTTLTVWACRQDEQDRCGLGAGSMGVGEETQGCHRGPGRNEPRKESCASTHTKRCLCFHTHEGFRSSSAVEWCDSTHRTDSSSDCRQSSITSPTAERPGKSEAPFVDFAMRFPLCSNSSQHTLYPGHPSLLSRLESG
eukprot:1224409-Rhodomonas_salina.1